MADLQVIASAPTPLGLVHAVRRQLLAQLGPSSNVRIIVNIPPIDTEEPSE